MKYISRFHYLTQDISRYSHPELTAFACMGGASWIQLRIKNKIYEDWLMIAKETLAICKKYGAKLIINDNVQIAKEINADGIHLGKNDMNPMEARRLLGNNFIIGGTANTIEEVQGKIEEGCDYVGVGPYRFTSTKEKLSPVLGLEGIGKIVNRFSKKIPIIAIGGVNKNDIKPLLNAGVYGIAVSSAINNEVDKAGKTHELISEIQ